MKFYLESNQINETKFDCLGKQNIELIKDRAENLAW